jgi:AraC family transcriptional regulator
MSGSPGRRGTLQFYRADTHEPETDTYSETTVFMSSRELGWDGIVVEAGKSISWAPDNTESAAHYIGMNLGPKPTWLEKLEHGTFRKVALPPRGFWIQPARDPFSFRLLSPSHYGGLAICPEKMRRVLGHSVDLRYHFGLIDETLATVALGLLLETERGGATGPLFADALGIAFASGLARHAIKSVAPSSRSGGLTPKKMKLVLETIDDALGSSITVSGLAAAAELSPAHFAREFKRCTNESPHAYVMRRRLERARDMLLGGHSAGDVALRCGFSDGAHLARVFKQRFGLSPSMFKRRTGEARAARDERDAG